MVIGGECKQERVMYDAGEKWIPISTYNLFRFKNFRFICIKMPYMTLSTAEIS